MDWESLVELYCQTDGVIGLGRDRDLPRIRASFLNSHKVVTAWEGDRVVGAARLLSDGICYGWVHDVAVLPSMQRRGIGKRIMEEVTSESLLYGLTSSFEAVDFYVRMGFRKHKTAMARYRNDSVYLES